MSTVQDKDGIQCKLLSDGRCLNADEIAERAVKKVFAILGVDITKPEMVEEFRIGLRFSQSLRRATDKGALAVFVLFCVGVAGLLWTGLLHSLGGGGGK